MRNASSSIGLVAPLKKKNCEIGDILLYDRNMSKLCILKTSRYNNINSLDTTRYYNTNAVFFGFENKDSVNCKSLWISPTFSSGLPWAQHDRHIIRFKDANNESYADGSIPAGSFTIAIDAYTAMAAQSITVAANSTYADIAKSIYDRKSSGYITVYLYSEVDGGAVTGIAIDNYGYNSNRITITNVSGFGSIDVDSLSKRPIYTDNNGNQSVVNISASYSLEGNLVNDLFGAKFSADGFTWPGTTSTNYNLVGINSDYRCGCNYSKYRSYYYSNGEANNFIGDANAGTPMRYANFVTGADSSAAENRRLLYNKYKEYAENPQMDTPAFWISMYGEPSGSSISEKAYSMYVMSRMMQEYHTNSVTSLYYDNGLNCTKYLSRVTMYALKASSTASQTSGGTTFTVQTIDSTLRPSYPAASYCYNYGQTVTNGQGQTINNTGLEAGNWHLPTAYEVGLFMRDDIYTKINGVRNISGISRTALVANGGYYWSVAECNRYTAWYYLGYIGQLDINLKFIDQQSVPVLALDLES